MRVYNKSVNINRECLFCALERAKGTLVIMLFMALKVLSRTCIHGGPTTVFLYAALDRMCACGGDVRTLSLRWVIFLK